MDRMCTHNDVSDVRVHWVHLESMYWLDSQ